MSNVELYAVAYTDVWVSYEKVILRKRHRAVGKETGQTHHVVRLNKYLATTNFPIGALKLFFCQKCGKSYWGNLVLHT